jgi:glycosyltransferase involved in cell wall biosynthesis
MGEMMGLGFDGTHLSESQERERRKRGLTTEQMIRRLSIINGLVPYRTSIIIPVYNGKKYIERCINSAKSQTLDDIEIIVVDDGSTDNTLKIISEIPDITVLIKPNGGTASALNTGIRNAKGDWIHWLSADDMLYENAIELMLDEIQITPNMRNYIFYSHYDIIDENDTIIDQFIEPVERNLKTREERFKELLGNYYGNGSSTMIHKSVFEKIKYDESLPHSEDYDFMLNAMKNGYDMKLVNRKTLKYRRHKDQLTNKVGGSLSDMIRSKYG